MSGNNISRGPRDATAMVLAFGLVMFLCWRCLGWLEKTQPPMLVLTCLGLMSGALLVALLFALMRVLRG